MSTEVLLCPKVYAFVVLLLLFFFLKELMTPDKVVTVMQRYFLAAAFISLLYFPVNALSASITMVHSLKRNLATHFHLLLIKACLHSYPGLERGFAGARARLCNQSVWSIFMT